MPLDPQGAAVNLANLASLDRSGMPVLPAPGALPALMDLAAFLELAEAPDLVVFLAHVDPADHKVLSAVLAELDRLDQRAQ